MAYDFPDTILRGMTTTASTLLVILLPFKNATHILEADNMPACYVSPIINQALKIFEEKSQIMNVSKNIVDSIKEIVLDRMKFSQSGSYWDFLYSFTPLGRKELRKYPGISEKGIDSDVKPPESFILKDKENQKVILEKIKQNPDLFINNGDELISAFNNYNGKLVNYKNSKVLKHHDSLELTTEVANVYIDPMHLDMLDDESTLKVDDDYSDDYSEYYEDDYSDDGENENSALNENSDDNSSGTNNNSSCGPLAKNISILKEIAEVKGYTPEECTLFVTRYTDWITDDTQLLVMHEEILLMGINCWRFIEYLPYMKSFAKFVIPLLGITSSESHCERAFWKQRRILGDQNTRTSVKLEKARLNYSVNE